MDADQQNAMVIEGDVDDVEIVEADATASMVEDVKAENEVLRAIVPAMPITEHSTSAEIIADRALPRPPDEPRVRLGKYSVPLKWVLSYAKASCNLCNGRGVAFIVGKQPDAGQKLSSVLAAPKTEADLCQCAVQRAVRSLRDVIGAEGATPVNPPPRPAAKPHEFERAVRKLDNLNREVARLQAEFAERRDRFDRGVAATRAKANEHACKEQDSASAVITLAESSDRLREQIAELEAELSNRKQLLVNTEVMLKDVRKEKQEAANNRLLVEGSIDGSKRRFDDDTKGLRKEIEKATRRRDHAQALYRDVVGDESTTSSGEAA